MKRGVRERTEGRERGKAESAEGTVEQNGAGRVGGVKSQVRVPVLYWWLKQPESWAILLSCLFIFISP